MTFPLIVETELAGVDGKLRRHTAIMGAPTVHGIPTSIWPTVSCVKCKRATAMGYKGVDGFICTSCI